MLLLKVIYPVFVLSLFAIFHALYAGAKVPYGFIILVFLSAAPMICLYKKIPRYTMAILSFVFFVPYMIFALKANFIDTAFAVIIFNSVLGCLAGYARKSDDEDSEWESRINEDEKAGRELSDKIQGLARAESLIKENELSTVSLYEVTKKMSEDLKFNDIFGVFSAFLKSNFTFRKCDLLILNWENDKPGLERRYSVWSEAEKALPEPDFDCGELIKIFVESPRKLYFSRREDARLFDILKIKEPSVETYIGIPLASDGRVVAILTVQNLSREALEKFIILSMQFALEIKKVLLYESVEKMATTDSLTSLYVRQYFSERLGEELQRSKRYKLKFALLAIDIDNFKQANDTYGHLVGDVILKSLGQILKENTREIDLVSRYGGEEFALALPETGPDGAKVVAERIRKRVEENIFRAYDEKLKITISTGIAIYPRDSVKLKDLLEKSDKAMYAAKKMGKNLVCEYKREYNIARDKK